MKKINYFLFVMSLLILNIAFAAEAPIAKEEAAIGVKETQTYSGTGIPSDFDWNSGDYNSLDWNSLTAEDWKNIPPARIPDVPKDKLEFTELTKDQKLKLTSDQIAHSDNIAKIGDLRALDPIALNKAVAQKYPGISFDITNALEEVKVSENGDAFNGKIKVNLKEAKNAYKDCRILATDKGWIINDNTFYGDGLDSIKVNADGTFNVKNSEGTDNLFKLQKKDSASTFKIDSDGTITMGGYAELITTVGGASVKIITPTSQGQAIIRKNSIETIQAIVKGDNFILSGAKSNKDLLGLSGLSKAIFGDGGGSATLNFANGKLTQANLRPFSCGQTTLKYAGAYATTTGYDLPVYFDKNTYLSASGNRAYLSENTVMLKGQGEINRNDLRVFSKNEKTSMSFTEISKGKTTLTAGGKITIEDSNSIFTGLQDQTILKKNQAQDTSEQDSDFYTVTGTKGDIATIKKKITIGIGNTNDGILKEAKEDYLEFKITKQNDKTHVLVDQNSINVISKHLEFYSNSIPIYDKKLYLEAGNENYAVNEFGAGQYQGDGKTEFTNILPKTITSNFVGNKILVLNDQESSELGKALSLDVKNVDIEIINKNPRLKEYLSKTFDMDKLENAIDYPESTSSKTYLNLLQASKNKLDSSKELFTKANEAKNIDEKKTILIQATKELLQSEINLNVANNKDVTDLVNKRAALDNVQKIESYIPTKNYEELIKLKNSPEYSKYSKTLSQIFSGLANDVRTVSASQSLAMYDVAIAYDPKNQEAQKAKQKLETETLKQIEKFYSKASEEQLSALELSKAGTFDQARQNVFDWAKTALLNTNLGDYGDVLLGTTKLAGEQYTQEQIELGNKYQAAKTIRFLSEKGYSLDEIQAMSIDPNKFYEVMNIPKIIEKINSDTALTQEQKTERLAYVEQIKKDQYNNLRNGLDIADVSKLASGDRTGFTFEAGYTFDSTIFQRGTGFVDILANDVLTTSNLLLGAVAEIPFATTGITGVTTLGYGAAITTKGVALGAQAGKATTGLIDVVLAGKAGRQALEIKNNLAVLRTELTAAEKSNDVVKAQRLTKEIVKLNTKYEKITDAATLLNDAKKYKNIIEEKDNAIEIAKTDEIKQIVTKDKDVILSGEANAYKIIDATEGKVYLKNQNAADEINSVVVKEVNDFVENAKIIQNGKYDAKTTETLQTVAKTTDTVANQVKLTKVVDNSDETTKVIIPNKKVDHVNPEESARKTIAIETEKARKTQQQLNSVKNAHEELIKIPKESDEILAKHQEIKYQVDLLTDQAVRHKPGTVLEIAKTGDKCGEVELSGAVMKIANEMEGQTGSDILNAFRAGVEEAVSGNPELTIAFQQKQVLFVTKSITETEAKKILESGLSKVKDFLKDPKNKAVAQKFEEKMGTDYINKITGRYGVSTVTDGTKEGTIISLGRAEISGALSQERKIVDLTDANAVKAAGGELRAKISNSITDKWTAYVQKNGKFTEMDSTKVDEFLNTLDDLEFAEMVRGIPQGKYPSTVEINALRTTTKQKLDDALRNYKAGSITEKEFGTIYKTTNEKFTDELNKILTSHDKFNEMNGVAPKIKIENRATMWTYVDDIIKSGKTDGIIGSMDVNSAGEKDLLFLAEAIKQKRANGANINDMIAAARTMDQNVLDTKLTTMFNKIGNSVADVLPENILSEVKLSALSGDEIGFYMSKRARDIIFSKTGKEPVEFIRTTVQEADLGITVSGGQTTLKAGDTVADAMKRADTGLNYAKNIEYVPNKNAATIVSQDSKNIQVITDGNIMAPGKDKLIVPNLNLKDETKSVNQLIEEARIIAEAGT